MDKKKKEKFLQELKKIEKKHPGITNEMSLIDRTNKLIALLIRIFLEKT